MKKIVLSALAVASLAGTTFGQTNIGPSLGTVELRWRERSTAGFNGSYVLPAGTTGLTDNFVLGTAATPSGTPNLPPNAASITAQDASVVLVLEARVTQAAGISGNAIRGLFAADFSVTTNQTNGGFFNRNTANLGSGNFAPVGSAPVSTNTLGFNPAPASPLPAGNPPNATGIPGWVAGQTAIVAPFRRVANFGGSGLSALGVGSSDRNTLDKVTLSVSDDLFSPTVEVFDPDLGANVIVPNPYAAAYSKGAQDTWVPVYVAIYSISDVSTARDIVFSVENSSPNATDYGFRTWRGANNPQNGDIDVWALSPGFQSAPTFTVSIVPAPGAAALLGLGGLIATRRRRTA